jgi:hypothetical protein
MQNAAITCRGVHDCFFGDDPARCTEDARVMPAIPAERGQCEGDHAIGRSKAKDEVRCRPLRGSGPSKSRPAVIELVPFS